MNCARGVGPSRLGSWSGLPCPPIGLATGATRANACTDAHQATPQGYFRSSPPGDGRCAARRTPYKLHSQDVRSWVRG